MKHLMILLVLALAACGAPNHPLTYVSPGDPVWSLNPDQTSASAQQAVR